MIKDFVKREVHKRPSKIWSFIGQLLFGIALLGLFYILFLTAYACM